MSGDELLPIVLIVIHSVIVNYLFLSVDVGRLAEPRIFVSHVCVVDVGRVTGNSFWAQQLVSEPSSSHRRVTGAISAANGSRFRILTKSEVLKNDI